MLPVHPRKIAVLRASALGDLVMALPALEALRARYPQAEMVLLGRPLYAELLAGRPSPVDRVVAVPPMDGIAERDGEPVSAEVRAEFVQRMRDERFDIALQMHGGGRHSNHLVRELGAGFTAGMRAPGAPALDAWIPYLYYQPEILRLLEVAELVGAPPVTVRPHLAVAAEDFVASRHVLPETGWPLAVLHPGASDPRRRWAPEKFAEVGDALVAEGLQVAIVDAESEVAHRVTRAMTARAENLAGRLSLSALVGTLARASVLVANDSGPLHVANALGTPTVGIYWCGNLINAEPATRATNRPAISWRLACPVCGADCTEASCPHEASFVDDVAVADVLAEALDLVGLRGARRREVPARERVLEPV